MFRKIKLLVPWYIKLSAKLLLARIPFKYSLWRRLSLFQHGCMEDPDYVFNVVSNHVARSSLYISKETCALEIGPGDSLLSSLVHYALGIEKTILVDAGSFARTDIAPYLSMINYLVCHGFDLKLLGGSNSLDELLGKINATYLTQGLASMKEIPDSSVDLIWSQAVLEHIRYAEFDQYLQEMHRVLKPTGICSHRVDLKDHLGGGLNNLRFSQGLWESEFFSSSGFYTNRIRFADMLSRFDQAGFDLSWVHEDRWGELPIPLRKIHSEFQGLDIADLTVSGFDVLLKPAVH
jgi:SAM-dependent methyltransferase